MGKQEPRGEVVSAGDRRERKKTLNDGSLVPCHHRTPANHRSWSCIPEGPGQGAGAAISRRRRLSGAPSEASCIPHGMNGFSCHCIPGTLGDGQRALLPVLLTKQKTATRAHTRRRATNDRPNVTKVASMPQDSPTPIRPRWHHVHRGGKSFTTPAKAAPQKEGPRPEPGLRINSQS